MKILSKPLQRFGLEVLSRLFSVLFTVTSLIVTHCMSHAPSDLQVAVVDAPLSPLLSISVYTPSCKVQSSLHLCGSSQVSEEVDQYQ